MRSLVRTALILRSRSSGESNREVWLLSPEEGVVRATVFGGPRSRLRAHASPFNSGTIWLYRDPVRDSRKVTDFDVTAWRPGLRELYERAMAAEALAETVLASQGGGGNWKISFGLCCRFLDTLEGTGAEFCGPVFVYFLWNWAALLGQRPPLACASCACESAADGVLWYDRREGDFLCSRCAGLGGNGEDAGGLLSLGEGARRWLAAGENSGLSGVPVSFGEARAVVMAVMEDILGKRLPTWNEV
jgi:DNA repair protein RecO (recombination protein O)